MGVIVFESKLLPDNPGCYPRGEDPVVEDPESAQRLLAEPRFFLSEDAALEWIEKMVDERGLGPVLAENDEWRYHERGFVIVDASQIAYDNTNPQRLD